MKLHYDIFACRVERILAYKNGVLNFVTSSQFYMQLPFLIIIGFVCNIKERYLLVLFYCIYDEFVMCFYMYYFVKIGDQETGVQ